MFKKISLLCLCVVAAFCLSSMSTSSTLAWRTDYAKVLQESKSSGKPIFLFFTGSDWCVWCKRLEQEVFNQKEFIKSSDKFIFVMVDLPMKTNLPASLEDQNERLQEQFSVKQFPTVVIIDGDEKVIGTTGYKSGGPRRYLTHLKQLVGDAIVWSN